MGTVGHRGPRVGRSWLRGNGSGGRYPLAGGGGWGVHAGEGRGAGLGVKAASLLGVSYVFGRDCGVGRACPGLQCPSLCKLRCGGGL